MRPVPGGRGPTQSWRDPINWTRYTVKNEEFSVTLPAVPAMITNKEFSAKLNKERRHRYISTAADGVRYTIFAYENPSSHSRSTISSPSTRPTTNSNLKTRAT